MDSLINEYFEAAHKGLLTGNTLKASTLSVSVPTRSGLLVATPDVVGARRPDPPAARVNPGAQARSPSPAAATAAASASAAELMRLRERLRTTEETLAMASAKKESLKKTNMQLVQDKMSLEQRLEIYFAETSSNVEDCKYWRSRAQEAVKAMTGMREYHSHEIKLLQRALMAAAGRAQFRISDTAELIERLGRAVIQRDEALRERTKLQDAVQAMRAEFTAISSDRNKIVRQSALLQKKVAKLERVNKTLLKGQSEDPAEVVSDFEQELRGFERRYSVLGEGVAGADHVVKRQDEDLRKLSIRLNICEADNETLRRDLQQWRTSLQNKDAELADVRKELSSFDQRLGAATTAEAEAVERAQRLEKELSKTIVELRKHKDAAFTLEQSLNQNAAEQIVALTISSALDRDDLSNEKEVTKPVQLVTHTGEIALISIVTYEKSGKYAVKAVDCDEPDSGPLYLYLDSELVENLLATATDEEGDDIWHELIYTVGFARNPVKTLVMPELVLNETVFLLPADLPLILKIYSYDAHRWYLTGFDEILQRVVDLRLTLDASTATLVQEKSVQAVLVKNLTLTELNDESLVLKFNNNV